MFWVLYYYRRIFKKLKRKEVRLQHLFVRLNPVGKQIEVGLLKTFLKATWQVAEHHLKRRI